MWYIKIRTLDPLPEADGYMEVYNGNLQRLTDLDGNVITPVSYSVVDSSPEQPSWALSDPNAPPSPPLPVPDFVTKRQFLIQLIRSGMVDPSEGSTLVTQPPVLMNSVLNNMPAEMALEARLSWAAMTQVDRYSPLTLAAAASAGTTEEQLDDFFRAAAALI